MLERSSVLCAVCGWQHLEDAACVSDSKEILTLSSLEAKWYSVAPAHITVQTCQSMGSAPTGMTCSLIVLFTWNGTQLAPNGCEPWMDGNHQPFHGMLQAPVCSHEALLTEHRQSYRLASLQSPRSKRIAPSLGQDAPPISLLPPRLHRQNRPDFVFLMLFY
jgi:hypothetical protein